MGLNTGLQTSTFAMTMGNKGKTPICLTSLCILVCLIEGMFYYFFFFKLVTPLFRAQACAHLAIIERLQQMDRQPGLKGRQTIKLLLPLQRPCEGPNRKMPQYECIMAFWKSPSPILQSLYLSTNSNLTLAPFSRTRGNPRKQGRH